MMTLTVGKRNQVTLPKAVREGLGVQPGDALVAEVVGGAVVLSRESGHELPLTPPPTRDPHEVLRALGDTGRYSADFLASLSEGMTDSAFFSKES